ncbi:similar to glutaredoxin domain-containing protein [Plenodomus lingam JN3]|uniref:Glutaredoxin-like protein n=1 Tax=Leptosphaeria maculans (strain JN3 / isolate v23.1.3 / race Av1-4-5-6-7-8) TaxID=985895 RepID=E4ZM39_LEPMJ|nr:similar to glutaredoxin domain-containing protein [Plenodomus lingam JN3]CBX92388.1 similar to glutaredoxin domain-containing protein [Plenodomus lingam JN3]
MFRATARLLDCRIIFFTRSPCGLCDTAKAVVQSVQAKRPLEYKEINVMDPGQEEWKNLYEFDTPVIHIDKAGVSETTSFSSLKLMHRFTEDEVLQKMDEAERS